MHYGTFNFNNEPVREAVALLRELEVAGRVPPHTSHLLAVGKACRYPKMY